MGISRGRVGEIYGARLAPIRTKLNGKSLGRFKAFRIFSENNKNARLVVDVTLAERTPGEAIVKTAYSSVNYKNALAATGAGGRIIRRIPLTGGIVAAGTVVSFPDSRFKPGDEVICTSYDMGLRTMVAMEHIAASRANGSCYFPLDLRSLMPWRSAPQAIQRHSRFRCSNKMA